MPVDHYAVAEEIASLLTRDDLPQEAKSIRDAVAEGATATEILMHIRFLLKKLSGRRITRQDTQAKIDLLMNEIDRVIPPG